MPTEGNNHLKSGLLRLLRNRNPFSQTDLSQRRENIGGFRVAQMVKNLPAIQEIWVQKIPWRRKWQHTPVFLPGEFHEQRSLAGYSPWGRKESDMTDRLTYTHTKENTGPQT